MIELDKRVLKGNGDEDSTEVGVRETILVSGVWANNILRSEKGPLTLKSIPNSASVSRVALGKVCDFDSSQFLPTANPTDKLRLDGTGSAW